MDVEDKNNDKMEEGDKLKGEKGKQGNVTGTTKRSATGRREGTNNNMSMGGLTQKITKSTTKREEFPR
jgi:hypothetical protein